MGEALERAQVRELNARANMWTMLTFWSLVPLCGLALGALVLVVWGIASVT
ncbi:MAG: hypothetical protein V4515_14360 [Chloroflexota bacterium]